MLLSAATLLPVWSAGAAAEAPAGPAAATDPGEIIVTARKREETLQAVPVVATAITAAQIETRGVLDLKDVAKLAPGLVVGESLLSVGTQISLRGVGTSVFDPGIDQSVSLNIDGLQLTQGLAFQSAFFDMAQIEVLKGPQALFYGKSSPGGVIAIHTADPGPRTEVTLQGGYDFETREKRGQLILSGPLTDSFGLRLAGQYSKGDGFFHNTGVATPGTGALNPSHDRASPWESYMLRATALWEITPTFTARLKANYVHDRTIYAGAIQFVSCPEGAQNSFFINADCKLDRNQPLIDLDPAVFTGIRGNGAPYNEKTQRFGTLDLNYDATDDISINATTGYYRVGLYTLYPATESNKSAPTVAVENEFRRRDVTQEVRVNSDFSSPLNFTVGGFYQNALVRQLATTRGNAALGLPPIIRKGSYRVRQRVYSLFGQGRWKITPELELAAGLRWTDETKSQVATNVLTPTPTPIIPATPRVTASNVSPEVTLTYRPTDDVTVFGALKRAYKSGGFTISAAPGVGLNNAFGDERVDGGELGLKTRLLDRQLLFNVAGYYYKYKGLQVGAIDSTPLGPITRVINAGSARIYGIEMETAYRPQGIAGLSLNGSLSWNHARFVSLNGVPCYGGQRISDGCDQLPSLVTGRFTAQSLDGARLIRSPDWQAIFGFDYEVPVGSGAKIALSNSNTYSSRYVTTLGRRADFFQGATVKVDLTVALRDVEDRWELAVVGKNLTNRLTAGNCAANSFAQGASPAAQVFGGTTLGPNGLDEVACFVDAGRSVMLRLTWRPFK